MPETVARTTKNRWLILLGGVLVQLAIGAVYAWSTFSKAFVAPESAMHLTKWSRPSPSRSPSG